MTAAGYSGTSVMALINWMRLVAPAATLKDTKPLAVSP